jgi:hypothetical protein
MNTPYSPKWTGIEPQLVMLTAPFAGLRRFVLEHHSQTTGEAMKTAELRLESYIDAEVEKLLALTVEEISPEYAALLDPRKGPPPHR